MTSISLSQLNTLPHDAFTTALSGLFEGDPWIVERAWDDRPFASLDDLYTALCNVLYGAPEDQQIAILRAHPDLVGRAALSGTLSPASTAEQSAAGLDALSPAEIAGFTRLNAEYHAKFGFPFVICARENKKDSILTAFPARLANDRETEIATALAEVAKICRLRLLDTISAA
jgi:2-oxo-4-hydroxy-4-carboxy-5-ureidoimidazoline decarboxylase